MSVVISNVHVVTVSGGDHPGGHIVVDGDRITAVGAGSAPPIDGRDGETVHIDGSGCMATPGLVNTHHHLFQWASQGLAPDGDLYAWIEASFPLWARMDAEVVADATSAGLGWLALSGCTTTADHHYLFPRGRGDLLAAAVRAADELGLRFHLARGFLDRQLFPELPLGQLTEDAETILIELKTAIDRYHDPSPGSRLRVAVAPCSPFTVSGDLLAQATDLARGAGVRLHTHLAETLSERQECGRRFGLTPVRYADSIGWLGQDVWLAHCVQLEDGDLERLAATGTGIAHCPSSNARLGAGIARVCHLLEAGATVGLGVDGASAELAPLAAEMRQALWLQRARYGAPALTARQALHMATLGGARCLGREAELGSLEVGKLADIALWRVDGFHAAIDDPVLALTYGATPPLARLLVGGRTVVADGELVTVPHDGTARRGAAAHRRLAALADAPPPAPPRPP
ncbi:8-oxoguanine deaminase [Spirillospora sp. NPDC127200]